MGLFDQLSAQTPQGAQLRAGLLGMGAGLLQGSTGHYGQFGPALGQGFAMAGQGMQNQQMMQMRQRQMDRQKQLQDLRAMQLQREISNEQGLQSFLAPPAQTNGAQAFPVGSAAESLNERINAALTSPNPQIREWGFKMQTAMGRGQGMSGLVPTDQGYAYRNPDGTTGFLMGENGQPLMPVSLLNQDPTRQGNIAQSRAYGTQTGKSQAEREASLPADLAQIENMERSIDNILNHPGLSSAVGWQGSLPVIPGTRQADFVAASKQLEGQAFLQAFESLKGGGQITEVEGQKATQAIGRLDRAQSEEEYKRSLQDLKDVLSAARQRIQQSAGQAPSSFSAEPAQPAAQPSGFSSLWGG